MDRLAAALLVPLERAWARTTEIAAESTDAERVRVACLRWTHAASACLQDVVDLLHATLEARQPGSTRQAGAEVADWLDRLQDLSDVLRRPQPRFAVESSQACALLQADISAGLQRQLLHIASGLEAGPRRRLVRRMQQRERQSRSRGTR